VIGALAWGAREHKGRQNHFFKFKMVIFELKKFSIIEQNKGDV
jgi:hypothetical protein